MRIAPLMATCLFAASLSSPARGERTSRLIEAEFRSVGDIDSIPMGAVMSLGQDDLGFLWIGTQEGLSRFDGYQFKVFRQRPGTSNQLQGNFVTALAPGGFGALWVGTFTQGLSRYEPNTESFHRFRADHDLPSHRRINALTVSDAGRLWIGSDAGLDYLDSGTEQILHFPLDIGQPAGKSAVRSLLLDRNEGLWIGTIDGLLRVEMVNETSEATPLDSVVSIALTGITINALLEAEDGRIWVGTMSRGIRILDPATMTVTIPAGEIERQDRIQRVNALIQPSVGEIWVGHHFSGIAIRDSADGSLLRRLRHDPSSGSTIKSDIVGSLLIDQTGLVWVGNWGGGLQFHNPAVGAFQHIRHSPAEGDGLSTQDIYRVIELSDGRILAGGRGQATIDILDLESARVESFALPAGEPGASAPAIVSSVHEAGDGTLWFGNERSDVFARDPINGELRRMTIPDSLIPATQIFNIISGDAGSLWLGTRDGLVRLDPESGKFSLGVRPDKPIREYVSSMARQDDGKLWLGTLSGLYAVSADLSQVKKYTREQNTEATLSNNGVIGLLVDRDGGLWVGTTTGLDRLIEIQDGVARFESLAQRIGREGLPNENLLQDGLGWIWIEANIRFNPETWEVQRFGTADGLDSVIWRGASWRMRDGRLLFGGMQGVLIVDPSRINAQTRMPPLVATSITVDQEAVYGDFLEPRIVVPPMARGFSVGFAALEFLAPQRVQYAYRLQGFDPDWIASDADTRTAAYTSLPAGEYTLQIKAANRSSPEQEQILAIPVSVVAAYFETMWFRLLIASMLLLLGVLAYKMRVRRLKQQKRELEQLVQARTIELETLNATLKRLSNTDTLTGIANRRAGREQLRRREERCRKDHQPLALILLDIDHFKAINDRHGHDAGDAVLIEVAERLQDAVRPGDLVCRWGGEEFLVILPKCEKQAATLIAERMRFTIEDAFFGEVGPVTASFGVSVLAADETIENLIKRADAAMYHAKESGRNQVTTADC